METDGSQPGNAAPDGERGCDANQSEREAALRTRITEHCRWIYTFDRAYSVRAFDYYAELLPWLKLERKK